MNVHLPTPILNILSPFSQLFSSPTWKKAQLLCVGAILCQGARRISSILHIMGMAHNKGFGKYHRFLNRDEWSPLMGAKILFGLLVSLIPPNQTLMIVFDDTVERRKGRTIKAKGCYRDAVRSTQSHVVTCYGLKWMSLCLLVKLPWNTRPWALPFLTFLQYPKKYDEKMQRSHRTSMDYAILAAHFLREWLPKRRWVMIGDGAFACVELMNACRKSWGHLISRLRIDARLYSEPPDDIPGKRGRKATKGKRIETFKSMLNNKELLWQEAMVTWYGGIVKKIQYLSGVDLMYKPNHPVAKVRWVLVKDSDGKMQTVPLVSSNPHHTPEFIIEAFVMRFSIEILFEEARAHLGMETQRQWSDKAIIRSTPLIFGLFSIICLIALKLREIVDLSVSTSAWYAKNPDEATFSDIIAYVRRFCWADRYLINSTLETDMIKFKRQDLSFLIDRIAASP